MLTADLASVRRRGAELRLTPTDDARRAQVAALAAAVRSAARAAVGRPREEVEEAMEAAAIDASGDEAAPGGAGRGADQKLRAAVLKLVGDGCRFEEPNSEAATALRRQVFERAAAAHRAGPAPAGPEDVGPPALPGAAAGFDRAAVLAAIAAERGVTPEDIEGGLFADRPGAQRLLAVEGPPPAALAAGFALSEAQAVLLRATKLRALVRARDAVAYRHLFRTLKFLRLLPVIAPSQGAAAGYVIELDGPLSLFQGGNRYGLQLGLALGAIAACDAWSIEADVAWGPDRRRLRFALDSGRGPGAAAPPNPKARAATPPPALPDELATFLAAFERLGSPWRIDREPAILELPGVGLCVPDLAFVRAADGARVHFELLGYWSRDAVWRRVDLVRAGLPHRILFAASRTLRVGEAALDDTPTAALYVFTRVLNAKEILSRIEQLAG